MEAYLTVKDVAVLVRLTEQTIRRYTMKKKIPFHKINRTVRFKKNEIEQWVENRKPARAVKVAKKIEKPDRDLFSDADWGVCV